MSAGSADDRETLDPLSRDLPDGGGAAAPTLPARYRVLGELGRGGMGVVYRVRDAALDRVVALKTTGAVSPERSLRFRREARAAARLDHPGIVRLLDVGEAGATLYYTMELVDGPSLDAHLDAVGPLPTSVALRIAADVADALDHAHGRGIVHRDIKPGNILLADGMRPRVTDFGVALDLRDDTLTATAQVLGTLAYMAPEQVRGDRSAIGPATDVFALGAVLYHMLTGAAPYAGEAPSARMREALAPSTRGAALAERLPPIALPICRAALAWEPAARYPTAAALALDLRRALDGRAPRGVSPGVGQRLAWWARRRARPLRLAAALTGALALAALGTALHGAWERRAGRQEAEAHRVDLEARLVDLEAAGRFERIEGLIADFAEVYGEVGGPAVPRTWLAHAQRLRARGDDDGELRALAAAYTAADEALRPTTLRALAEAFHDRERWAALHATMQTLGTDADDPLALAAALGAGDFDAARRTTDPTLGPVLGRLLRGTPTAHGAPPPWAIAHGGGVVLDVDGDGDDEVVLSVDDATLAVTEPAPALPLLFTVSLPAGATLVEALATGAGAPDLLVTRGPGDVSRLFRLTAAGAVERHRHGGRPLWSVASADLDGDGLPEHYGGAAGVGRTLLELKPGAPVTAAHRATAAAASDVMALEATDLDGDGALELAAAVGPWQAFDLRIFRRRPGAEALELTARHRIGAVHALASPRAIGGGRLLLAVKTDAYGSRLHFPAERPFGAPPGLYGFTWDGETLAPRLHLPASRLAAHDQLFPERLRAVDLDGDGVDEIVGSDSWHRTHLYRQRADGSLTRAIVRGVVPLVTHDVDGDGDGEVIAAHEGRIWVLGAGERPLPSVGADRLAPAAPPPPGEARLEARWRRAEGLASIGLSEHAAQAHIRAARLARLPSWAAAARLRAARLLEARDDTAAAQELYRQALADPEHRSTAAHGWARTAAENHEFEALVEAVAVLDALGESAPAAITRRLEASRAAPTVELDLTGRLHPAWQLDDPVAVRRTAEGLRVTLVADQGIVARLPLVHTGGRIAIEIEGALGESEWGSRVLVGVRRPGHPPFGVGLMTLGGGGLVHHEPLFYLPRPSVERRTLRPVLWLGTGQPVAMRRAPARFGYLLDFAHDHGIAAWLEPDGARVRWQIHRWDAPVVDDMGPVELFIGDDPRAPARPYSSATALTLRRLRITGAHVATSPGEPDARHALADGDPARARALVAAIPPAKRSAHDHLTHAVALEELDPADPAVADALAASVARSGGLVERSASATRARPTRGFASHLTALLRWRHVQFGARVAAATGEDFVVLLHRAWGVMLGDHPDDPLLADVLGRHRAALLSGGPHLAVRADLLLADAVAALGAGRIAQGLASADALAALLADHPVFDSVQADTFALTRAELSALNGDAPNAARILRARLAETPTPDILRDRIRLAAGLASSTLEALDRSP